MEEYVDYIQYPEDDYCYHCKSNSVYPNIGLMENTLANMNEYPYLPCCYKERKIIIIILIFTISMKKKRIINNN